MSSPANGQPADRGTAESAVLRPDDSILLLVVGGPQRLVAQVEKFLVTRMGLAVGVVGVKHGEDACSRVAGGGFDGLLVFDDLVGRSTLRALRERKLRIASVCVVEQAEPAQRAAIRAQLRHEGALACIFAEELSGALLETAVIHAFEMQRLLDRTPEPELGSRTSLLHRIAAAQARMQLDRNFRFRVVHIDVAGLDGAHLGPEIAAKIEADFLAHLNEPSVVRLEHGSYALLIEEQRYESSALERLEQIRDLVQHPFRAAGGTYSLDAGIGAVSGVPEGSGDVLLARAVELSKARSPAPNANDLAWMSGERPRLDRTEAGHLGQSLHRALALGQFALFYQPVVGLEKLDLIGFEALLRLDESTDAPMMEAGAFISEAERSALIVPMGYWALETAIRQMTEWDRDFELGGRISISINLSTRQCEDPTLLARIRTLLMTTGCDPSAVRVEIGEDSLVRERQRTRALIQGLAETRVGIWIEDFGLGRCTVDDLRGLPISALKVDKSMVHALDGTSSTTGRIKHLVDAARSLRVAVMAEGIENQMQANILRWLGCTVGQGYLYSRPLAVGDAFGYLAAALQAPTVTARK